MDNLARGMYPIEKEVDVMSKAIQAFLALAVIAGLVIALDPQARAEAANSWQEFKSTVIKWQNSLEVRFGEPSVQSESDVQVSHQPESPSEEASNDDRIIQVDWDAVWSALQRAWVDFTVRLKSVF